MLERILRPFGSSRFNNSISQEHAETMDKYQEWVDIAGRDINEILDEVSDGTDMIDIRHKDYVEPASPWVLVNDKKGKDLDLKPEYNELYIFVVADKIFAYIDDVSDAIKGYAKSFTKKLLKKEDPEIKYNDDSILDDSIYVIANENGGYEVIYSPFGSSRTPLDVINAIGDSDTIDRLFDIITQAAKSHMDSALNSEEYGSSFLDRGLLNVRIDPTTETKTIDYEKDMVPEESTQDRISNWMMQNAYDNQGMAFRPGGSLAPKDPRKYHTETKNE